MGFIIWGAGERGERLLHLLGRDKVDAFVDSYRAGTIVCGLPVILPNEYERQYSDRILFVSPNYHSDIVHQIEMNGWNQYLLYTECPMEIQWGYNIDTIRRHVIKMINGYRKVYLFGLSIYSLLVYEWLDNEGIEVILYPNENDRATKGNVIERLIGYRIENKGVTVFSDNKVLICNSDTSEELSSYDTTDIFDLNKMFQRSEDKSIKAFHNIYDGKAKRCFIVATGPSLRAEDLTFLCKHNEVCFSMNKVFYAFDETEWRPDYYLVTDTHITTMCRKEILELDAKAKFITELDTDFWENTNMNGLYKVHEALGAGGAERFSDNVAMAFEKARTVTFVAIQLAAYMGFQEIYLIGVDHSGGKEVNSPERHFYGSKDKHSFAMRWEPKGLLEIEKDYINAKRYAEKHGLKIYNATRGGYLDVFERKDLDELFKQIEKENQTV